MFELPDIDVLLPVRDPHVPWLREAVASIERQEDVKCHLVIVLHPDDADLEATLRDASIPTTLVWAPAAGNLSDALNVGLGECRAPFIARMDQDDIAEPQRLMRQLRELVSNPTCVAVGSDALLIDGNDVAVGIRRLPKDADSILKRSRWRSAIMHPTVMLRRDVVLDLGGYSPTAANVEDYDLWLRLLTRGSIQSINEPLLQYRLHGAQMTRTKRISAGAARATKESRIQLARTRNESMVMAHIRHQLWLIRQRLKVR